jgi:hypothetical protein
MSERLDTVHTERAAALFSTVPRYLQAYYWWAYGHPAAVRLFERAWLVNLILWGNYHRLSQDALDSATARRTLQIACAFGNLTERVAARIARDGAASTSWTSCRSSLRV